MKNVFLLYLKHSKKIPQVMPHDLDHKIKVSGSLPKVVIYYPMTDREVGNFNQSFQNGSLLGTSIHTRVIFS